MSRSGRDLDEDDVRVRPGRRKSRPRSKDRPTFDKALPGTVITRRYKGQLVQVKVLPKGFEFEGELYKSLSAVAKQITGSHWNGYRFFNLQKMGGDQ